MPEVEAPFGVGFVVQERADVPGFLAAWRLYLDNVGAHVGHQLPAELGVFIGQLQHPQSGQRAGQAVLRSVCSHVSPYVIALFILRQAQDERGRFPPTRE